MDVAKNGMDVDKRMGWMRSKNEMDVVKTGMGVVTEKWGWMWSKEWDGCGQKWDGCSNKKKGGGWMWW